jgi:hypothetical protein
MPLPDGALWYQPEPTIKAVPVDKIRRKASSKNKDFLDISTPFSSSRLLKNQSKPLFGKCQCAGEAIGQKKGLLGLSFRLSSPAKATLPGHRKSLHV